MIFFKGFKTYSTNVPNKNYSDFDAGIKKKRKYDELFYSWKLNGRSCCYTDRVLEKKGINEISFSADSKKQVLIRRYAVRCCLNLFRYHNLDYDGDGLDDLIIHFPADRDIIVFLLFLSSEADEGELLKHVATKIIKYGEYCD
ncbi:hypothetical protein [Bacteroides sp. 224]|uniref:hypothetical protein n=1 Tax=Bacteroides sp. 224 TaxID=2302936 RepID=UPI0013D14B3E|nr:hypothetical protein [Bacteroides sp. 224]NDV66560.1 hypothetical protein [Bacteroides sp. 224]